MRSALTDQNQSTLSVTFLPSVQHSSPSIVYTWYMRKSARNQPLPQEEVDYLLTLSPTELRQRAKQLYDVGWTLSAIGTPLSKPRTTVRAWVTSVSDTLPTQRPVPTPVDKTYVPKKPPKQAISEDMKARLAYLAPLASRYRAKLPDDHPSATANRELTALALSLYSAHASIQDIADAAGVTYRAMYRRIYKK